MSGVTVLVGAKVAEPTVLDAAFPSRIRVRVGDVVTFKANPGGTVVFAGPEGTPPLAIPVPGSKKGELMLNMATMAPTRQPGAAIESYDGTRMVGSGSLSTEPQQPGAPVNNTFQVRFPKAGAYPFTGFEGNQTGLVEVVPATESVPTQAQVDAEGKKELAALTAKLNAARAQAKNYRREPGPNGSTIHYVKAGLVSANGLNYDYRAQSYEFAPKQVTIKAGDTVVWEAPAIHTVTFLPKPPLPDFVLPRQTAKDAPPQLVINPKLFLVAKPSGVYDPKQYYNSGFVGPAVPNGQAFALTFTRTGTYGYVCAIHTSPDGRQGMVGTVIVKPR
jgi:plastocyanin